MTCETSRVPMLETPGNRETLTSGSCSIAICRAIVASEARICWVFVLH